MSGWIIVLLAFVGVTSGVDLRESCNRCGYRSGHQVQLHPRCSNENPSPKYFRDTRDCGKFYECNRGTAYEFLCSEGLAFNEETKICEPASRVPPCINESESALRPVDRTPVSKPNPGHSVDYEYPRASGSGQNRTCNICRKAKEAIPRHRNCPQRNGYYPVYFRHAADCSQFYQCDQGTAYLIQCPAGLHFNTRVNVCDYPRNVDCSEKSSNQSDGLNAVGGSRPNQQGSMVAGSVSTSSSPCPVCQKAKHVIAKHPMCPAKNGYYPVFFRHQTDCSKFYQCDNGSAFEIECPASLHFNTQTNVCDYPQNAGCSVSDDKSEEIVPSTEDPSSEPELEAEVEDESAIVGETHPNCPVITGHQEVSYWAHPRDCSKYFGCQWGCVEVFTCPEGYRWQDENKSCAEEQLVRCKTNNH